MNIDKNEQQIKPPVVTHRKRAEYFFTQWEARENPPKGWDVADAVDDGWTPQNIMHFIKTECARSVDTEPEPVSVSVAPETEQPTVITPTPAPIKLVEPDLWWKKLLLKKDGIIKTGSVENLRIIIKHHPFMAGVLKRNSFSNQTNIVQRPPWDDEPGTWRTRPLQDNDSVLAAAWVESCPVPPQITEGNTSGVTANISTVRGMLNAVASANSYVPLNDYLNGLVWDGEHRVDNFLRHYFSCDDTEYSRVISRKFMVSAAARALRPGCKMDTMLIIEGPQGLLKSTAIRELFGSEFFTDQISDLDSKDSKMEIQKSWAIEVGEMTKVTKGGQDSVKQFLSHQEDNFRLPYGTEVMNFKRRCILIGTINPDGNEYLDDPTGARRFWPVTAYKINIEGIKRDRNQLWAEAVQMLNDGVSWWLDEGTEECKAVTEQQGLRTSGDIWEPLIAYEVSRGTNLDSNKGFSIREALVSLNITPDKMTKATKIRMGRVLSTMGMDSKRATRNGVKETFYFSPRE